MMQPTPLRPDEQVAGGFLSVTLGGRPYELAVLPMRTNREFLRRVDAAVKALRADASGLDTLDGVVDFLAGQAETMMDLLIEYDQLGGSPSLPDREWIDTHATDRECYEGFKRVTAAASPLAEEALRIAPQIVPALIDALRAGLERGVATGMLAMTSLKSMKPSPPSTDGAPTSSSATSPTSSSTSTPTKPRSAGGKRRSRS